MERPNPAIQQFFEQLPKLTVGEKDVIVQSSGHYQRIHAHKAALCAVSPYFKTLFSSYRKIEKLGEVEIISIPVKEMEALFELHDWIYNKHHYIHNFEKSVIPSLFPDSVLYELLEASHTLQVSVVFECCYKKLAQGMTPSCFLNHLELAEKYDDKGMTNHLASFVAHNFPEVAKSNEFLKVTTQQMTTVFQQFDTIEFFMDDAMKGLLRWVEAEDGHGNREKTFLHLVGDLDFQYLSAEFLKELLRQPTIRKNYHILLLLNTEATLRLLTSVTLTEKVNQPKILAVGEYQDPPLKDRFSFINKVADKTRPSSLRIYNVLRNQWSEPKKLPFYLELAASVAWFDGSIYVFGGKTTKDGEIASTKIIHYCPGTNSITSNQNLQIPVIYPRVVVLGESIYILGAEAIRHPIEFLQRYNPQNNTCEVIESKSSFGMHPQIFSTSGKLYVISTAKHHQNVAGSDKYQYSIERYKPESDTWELVTDVPGEMSWFIASIGCEKVFLIPVSNGERGSLTCPCHVYDLSSGIWDVQKVKEELNYFCLPTITSVKFFDKDVLLFFSFNGDLEMYDVATGKWMKRSPSCLEVERHSHVISM